MEKNQSSKKVIKFPEKEFILRCIKCKINAFYIILNSDNPYDLKGFECMDCEGWFDLEPFINKLREEIKKEVIKEMSEDKFSPMTADELQELVTGAHPYIQKIIQIYGKQGAYIEVCKHCKMLLSLKCPQGMTCAGPSLSGLMYCRHEQHVKDLLTLGGKE